MAFPARFERRGATTRIRSESGLIRALNDDFFPRRLESGMNRRTKTGSAV